MQLKPNTSVKQFDYLVTHEAVLILVDYVDDQFTLRSQVKSNTVTNTPLDSFSFQSVSSFLTKQKT